MDNVRQRNDIPPAQHTHTLACYNWTMQRALRQCVVRLRRPGGPGSHVCAQRQRRGATACHVYGDNLRCAHTNADVHVCLTTTTTSWPEKELLHSLFVGSPGLRSQSQQRRRRKCGKVEHKSHGNGVRERVRVRSSSKYDLREYFSGPGAPFYSIRIGSQLWAPNDSGPLLMWMYYSGEMSPHPHGMFFCLFFDFSCDAITCF